jgi:hypothetical protein
LLARITDSPLPANRDLSFRQGQVTHLHDVEFPMLLPGIKVNTSPANYRGFNQLQLEKFDGKRWVPFGDVIGE